MAKHLHIYLPRTRVKDRAAARGRRSRTHDCSCQRIVKDDAEFREEDHPRDGDGKFSKSQVLESLRATEKREYWPKNYEGINRVHDWDYVTNLVNAAVRGDHIPAFIKNGESLLTGTHRAVANEALSELGEDAQISSIDFSDLDFDDDVKEKLVEMIEDGNFRDLEDHFGDRDEEGKHPRKRA